MPTRRDPYQIDDSTDGYQDFGMGNQPESFYPGPASNGDPGPAAPNAQTLPPAQGGPIETNPDVINAGLSKDWKVELQKAGGGLYNDSDLTSFLHNTTDIGKDPNAVLQQFKDRYAQRAAPTFSGGGSGGSADLNGDGKADPGWVKGSNGQWTNQGVSGGSNVSLRASGLPDRGPSGNFGGAISAGSSSQGPQTMADIMGQLKSMFPTGGFNKDAVTRRVSNVSDTLNRQKKSQMANNEAYLANRGLVGDGPQATAAGSLEDRLNQNYNSSVNDIYANESTAADSRMMQALQLATGMSTAQAQQAIDQFKATTERDLGFGGLALGNKTADQNYSLGQGGLALGNLNANNNFTLGRGNIALGNLNAQNSYNLGQDQLGLGRDTLASTDKNAHFQHIIDLLAQGMTLDEIAAAGYI